MSEFGGRKTERDNHYDALTVRDGSIGGGAERSNLRMACWACNNAKGSVSGPEFMASEWLAWRRDARPGAESAEVEIPDGVYTRSYRVVR